MRLRYSCLCVPVLLLLSGVAAAQPPRGDPPAPAPQAQRSGAAVTVEGTITYIQRETKQFTVRTADDRQVILSADERTELQSMGQPMKFADLVVGGGVTVTYAVNPTHFLALSIAANRAAAAQEPPRQPPMEKDVEPISIKGKIEDVKPDLSELTLRTFDDKTIVLSIDEDLRGKIKRGETTVPSVTKGVEVAALYIIENGKNKLVILRDIIPPPERSAGAPTHPTTPPPSAAPGGRSNTTVNKVNVSGEANVQALPLVQTPLPAGFIVRTNNPLGAIAATIVQVRGDMVILSTGAAVAPEPVPTPTGQQNPQDGGLSGGANQGAPAGQSAGVRAAEYFVAIGMNSKEPLILDLQTKIIINNQPGRLGDIRPGDEIHITLGGLSDGRRKVVQINVIRQPGDGTPPVEPRPNATARSGGRQDARVGTTNTITGRVLRVKGDLLIVQRGQNALEVLMMFNSPEPLRMDDSTRVVVNGRQGRLADLQPGMSVHVFLEVVNNVRRVIGFVVNQEIGR